MQFFQLIFEEDAAKWKKVTMIELRKSFKYKFLWWQLKNFPSLTSQPLQIDWQKSIAILSRNAESFFAEERKLANMS